MSALFTDDKDDTRSVSSTSATPTTPKSRTPNGSTVTAPFELLTRLHSTPPNSNNASSAAAASSGAASAAVSLYTNAASVQPAPSSSGGGSSSSTGSAVTAAIAAAIALAAPGRTLHTRQLSIGSSSSQLYTSSSFDQSGANAAAAAAAASGTVTAAFAMPVAGGSGANPKGGNTHHRHQPHKEKERELSGADKEDTPQPNGEVPIVDNSELEAEIHAELLRQSAAAAAAAAASNATATAAVANARIPSVVVGLDHDSGPPTTTASSNSALRSPVAYTNRTTSPYRAAFESRSPSGIGNGLLPSFQLRAIHEVGLDLRRDQDYLHFYCAAPFYLSMTPAAAFTLCEVEAARGNQSAVNNLGFCYHFGYGTMRDEKKAVDCYIRASTATANGGNGAGPSAGSLLAENNYAVCLLRGKGGQGKNQPLAISILRRLATENRLLQAMTNYATALRDGEGVSKDETRALSMLEECVKLNYPPAICQYGFCHDYGKGVKRDTKKAAEYYLKAAHMGHATAQYNSGLCFAKARGLAKNPIAAVEWYRKAVLQMQRNAEFNLAVCEDNGIGVPKNEFRACELYLRAASQGHATAMFNLAVSREFGTGGPKDEKSALVWYRKAAHAGHVDAQANLAWSYLNAVGVVERDEAKAFEWYHRAGSRGHLDSMFTVGVMYLTGLGFQNTTANHASADIKRSVSPAAVSTPATPTPPFSGAADGGGGGFDPSGNGDAIPYSATAVLEGLIPCNGGTPDYVKAMEWFSNAAAAGHQKAIALCQLAKLSGFVIDGTEQALLAAYCLPLNKQLLTLRVRLGAREQLYALQQLVSAMPAMSTLQELDLAGCRLDTAPLPKLIAHLLAGRTYHPLSHDESELAGLVAPNPNSASQSSGSGGSGDSTKSGALCALNLSSTSLNKLDAAEAVSGLRFNHTLTSLNLNNNSDFGCDGAIALASALDINDTLATLSLVNTGILTDGGEALARLLVCNTSLSALDLSNNLIGEDATVLLASALAVNRALLTLRLNGTGIRSGSIEKLAAALRENHTLLALSLARNGVNDSAIVPLASALRVNRSLTSLDLNGNSIGDDGARLVLMALTVNTGLRELRMQRNHKIETAGLLPAAHMLSVNRTLTALSIDCRSHATAAIAAVLPLNSSLLYLNVLGDTQTCNGHNCGAVFAVFLPFMRSLRHLELVRCFDAANSHARVLEAAIEQNHSLCTLHYYEPHRTERMRIQLNRNQRLHTTVQRNWQRVAVCAAFVRANGDSKLSTSILPLIPSICAFTGD